MTFDLDLYLQGHLALALKINGVRSVASTVPDGLFPYLVQMITSMRRCVACDDLWPWPISSRSFDLDLENRVRSVASAVLDGFFLYLAQMITIIRGCVVCYVFCRIWKFELLANFWNFWALTLKKKSTVLDGFFPYLAQIIISIRGCVACNDLWPCPIFSRSFGLDLENRVPSVASIVLDRFFPYVVQMITSMRRCAACHDLWPWTICSRSFDLVLTWGIQHDSIVWVIMRRRGYPQNAGVLVVLVQIGKVNNIGWDHELTPNMPNPLDIDETWWIQ